MSTYDPFEYIRTAYGVPARKEQRIEYTPGKGTPKTGRIVGANGHYLRLHFDGEPKRHSGVFHPTDGIRYLAQTEHPGASEPPINQSGEANK